VEAKYLASRSIDRVISIHRQRPGGENGQGVARLFDSTIRSNLSADAAFDLICLQAADSLLADHHRRRFR